MFFGLLAFCWISPFSKHDIPVRVLCHLKLDGVPDEYFNLLWLAWSAVLASLVTEENFQASLPVLLAAKACLYLLDKAQMKLKVLLSGLSASVALAYLIRWCWIEPSFQFVLVPFCAWFAVRLVHVGSVEVPVDHTKEVKLDRKKLAPSRGFFPKSQKTR